jgi:hypothetical protein
MSEQRKGVPAGASALIPRLFCRDPITEIEFCKAAFGAEEGVRRPAADGTVAHAMMLFGSAMLMIESEWPQATNRAPAMDGSSSVALYIFTSKTLIPSSNARSCIEARFSCLPPISFGVTVPRGFWIPLVTSGQWRRGLRRQPNSSGKSGWERQNRK